MTRWSMVVSYQVDDAPVFFPADHADDLAEEIRRLVEDRGGDVRGGLYVAVREIGAGGAYSVLEGGGP